MVRHRVHHRGSPADKPRQLRSPECIRVQFGRDLLVMGLDPYARIRADHGQRRAVDNLRDWCYTAITVNNLGANYEQLRNDPCTDGPRQSHGRSTEGRTSLFREVFQRWRWWGLWLRLGHCT